MCVLYIKEEDGERTPPCWSYILHEPNSTQTRLTQVAPTRESPLVNAPKKAPTSPLSNPTSFQDLPSSSTLVKTRSLEGVAPSNTIEFRCFQISYMTKMVIAHAYFLLRPVQILSWQAGTTPKVLGSRPGSTPACLVPDRLRSKHAMQTHSQA